MMENLQHRVKLMLNEHRYRHSLGVMDTAVKLAKEYDVDLHKAAVAGLIHDCAKGFSGDALLKKAKEYGIEIDNVYKSQPDLLHGPVGACIAWEEFGIRDEDILHAVRYHTTGCEDMSILDKVIYIADYIEPGRNFPGVDALRNEAFRNMDKSILVALNNTIKYIVERGQLIDMNTIKARNYILFNWRNGR